MHIYLPKQVETIIEELNKEGFEAYAVGGCVRDSYMGRTPEDWDITTSAKPEQVKKIFKKTFDTGIEHGTVTVVMDKENFEVTTYRVDGEYRDFRHPESVSFTSDLKEDLMRRDFTINAMAYNHKEGLIDVFDGIKDLDAGIIRCVGVAEERFSEDALRMLRAVRFSAQLGFDIEEKTKEAIKKLSPTLEHISSERVQSELVKLLMSDNPGKIEEAYNLGLTKVFLPEFDIMMVSEQINPHHIYTVGMHTIKVMENVPKDRILRISALLHDVAKPDCTTLDSRGINHFKGHPEKGAQMARKILRRLKFDNNTVERVCHFVLWHDANPELTPKSVRKMVSKIGKDYYPDMFALKRADVKGQNPKFAPEKLRRIDEYERLYNEIINKGECVDVKSLAINGGDLIKEGFEQGQVIGSALKELLSLVIENPELNEKETLLTIAKEQFLERN
ncbi:MAG: CCA tRNA nucleotidyltransferase [Eubacterium sp.]|nr:CCA tRNA nucleotidyltransferase [Eubacterium sp.]